MPGHLKIAIGAQEFSVPIKGTSARINDALIRYATVKGIETEGRTSQEVATDVLNSLLKIVRDVSLDQQRAQLQREHAATIEVTLAADNDL